MQEWSYHTEHAWQVPSSRQLSCYVTVQPRCSSPPLFFTPALRCIFGIVKTLSSWQKLLIMPKARAAEPRLGGQGPWISALRCAAMSLVVQARALNQFPEQPRRTQRGAGIRPAYSVPQLAVREGFVQIACAKKGKSTGASPGLESGPAELVSEPVVLLLCIEQRCCKSLTL